MLNRLTVAFGAACLLVAPCGFGRSEIAADAPLYYSVTTQSETAETWQLGAAAGLIAESYRLAHEKFLAALQTITGDGAHQAALIEPFACLGRELPTAPCHRIVELQTGTSDKELLARLNAEPARSARVVEMKIIFDGRFFQVPARMYDVRVDDGGALSRYHEVTATYITTYSIKLHQEDIATHRNDAPFDGTFGSKEARMHFWSGGQSPRLPMELDRSVNSIATLWAATMASDANGVLAGDYRNRDSLIRVRDLVAKDSTVCKTLHPNFLVVRDLGDQLWLTIPGGKKSLWNNFLIEPRCGFDY